MRFCMLCGSPVIWQSDFDAEDYGYSEEGVVGIYHCSNELNCNTYFELIDLFNNDDRHIKYFIVDD